MSVLSSVFKPAALALLVSLSLQVQAQSQAVTGLVVDSQGQPVANAKVHVHGRQQYVFTNAAGQFTIQSPIDAELHIAAKGFGDQFVKADQAQLKIALTAGGIERIAVSASGLHHYDLDMAHPVSVLSGEELALKTEPTIGETLKSLPGVHSNYYGPVAASPVIRGLDGPRVKMLSNGLDTGDVSRVGPDHAITADAITTEQIEVLRGPATLLYGSGAIGGVVNVVNNRIPRRLREPQTILDSRFNSVSDEKSLALTHDGSADQLAWHFDGFDRNSNDHDVPTFTNDEGETANKLANSWLDNQALNGGLSWVGSKGLFGVSVGHIDSKYGIPGHHAHAEEHTEEHSEEDHAEHADEGVYAAVKQDRVSLAGEVYSPISGIETLSFTGAYTDYQHVEMEGDVAGTTFKNKSFENRISAEHIEFAGWHGLIGFHQQHNDYTAVGAEAFTPPSDSDSYALFLLEEKTFGDVTAQLGARVERTKHNADSIAFIHDHEEDHEEEHEDEHGKDFAKFTAASVSAGLVWNFVPGYQWSASLSRSERAPSAAEIYANGAHIATSSYELGLAYQLDDDGEISLNTNSMPTEVANNIDIGFRKIEGDLTFSYNFFYNQIDNFLYQANTGLTMEDLAEHNHEDHDHEAHAEDDDHDHDHAHGDFDIYQYQQRDVRMYGLEFALAYQLNAAQQVSLFADSVRARLKDGGDLPRIPPVKAGVEYQYAAQQWSANVGATYYAKQNKVSEFESATAAYTSIDASLSYFFNLSSIDMTAFIKGTNLTDKLGYVHSSFIKEDAPLPGRAVTLGVTARF
jgi:iron complex outermembrane receptor protein